MKIRHRIAAILAAAATTHAAAITIDAEKWFAYTSATLNGAVRSTILLGKEKCSDQSFVWSKTTKKTYWNIASVAVRSGNNPGKIVAIRNEDIKACWKFSDDINGEIILVICQGYESDEGWKIRPATCSIMPANDFHDTKSLPVDTKR